MDELGFMYTYTPAYSPQYNGIEEVIGIGKHLIKKKRLQALLDGKKIEMNEMILNSFENINVL